METCSVWPFVSGFFHLAYCFQYVPICCSSVQSLCSMYQYFIPCYGQIPFHSVDMTHFFSPFICWWTLYLLGIVNNATVNIGIQVSVWVPFSVILGIYLEVVMYGCESWTIKKAECRRIDAFELWYWRRLLRVPWTARRSNQSILKEISPGCSLEGLMLKLELQYLATWCKELTHWKRPWCWERLRAGGEGDDRGWDGWMPSPTQWTWVWVDSGCWWWTGRPGVLLFMGLQRVGHDWATELNGYKVVYHCGGFDLHFPND